MTQWLWLVFVLGAALSWGAYGPTLHEGQGALGGNPWKAILCVGGAYFVIAVVVPVIILKLQGEPLQLLPRGIAYAGLAGVLGALGAICIVGALRNGGKPLYVMPLVFGGAPLVNVAVASLLHPPAKAPSAFLYLGFLLVLVGAGMVLYFKPSS